MFRITTVQTAVVNIQQKLVQGSDHELEGTGKW